MSESGKKKYTRVVNNSSENKESVETILSELSRKAKQYYRIN